eukprot:NODE_6439_length_506_cov_182.922395.p2 GENE.NODE_6439_length_506_cov_182.922395~~NODE_6439_length_506_cov_182.922395.p2  ORF type:complete len:86 (-),score=29.17 NODE_6439_length_506_cov_182.922395:231-488(-)
MGEDTLKSAFEHYDIFHHGTMSETGFISGMESLYSHLKDAENGRHAEKGFSMHHAWSRFFAQLDEEGTGSVYFPDFVVAIFVRHL